MDYFCNKSLSEVHENYPNDIYFVETPNKMTSDTHISNSLMYSVRNHVFWKRLFIELELNKEIPYYYSRHVQIMFTTGPGILNKAFNMFKLRDKLDYLPYKFFHPYGLADEIITNLTNNSDVYAVHIGKGSWETIDSKWIIFIYQEYKIILFLLLTLILPTFIRSCV